MFEKRLYINFSATKEFPEVNYELKSTVRRAILATLDYEDLIFGAEVSVTFCDNEYIRKLNGEFRDKDSATDVLSFPMYDFEEEEELPLNPDGSVSLGDIVVSLERAAEQAAEYGHGFAREVAFLCVHSTLHLLGYDHMTEDEESEMRAKQREVLSAMGLEIKDK